MKTNAFRYRLRVAGALFAWLSFLGPSAIAAGTAQSQTNVAGVTGPDVVVSDLSGVASWGSGSVNGEMVSAFSVGTTSCNLGDEDLLWIRHSPNHPVIRQNLYRLKDNRFEQIGTSWVKHGFFAVNDDNCGLDCPPEVPKDGSLLLPGCSDPYESYLNGDRTFIGPSSDINAFTGEFPWPRSIIPTDGSNIAYRLQARHADINPSLNSGAKYFVDGHYVTHDDAAAGNAHNNVSHRAARVLVRNQAGCIEDFCIVIDTSQAFFESIPSIYAWKNQDPSVQIVEQHVPGEGLFILGTRVAALNDGYWRYEYALYNYNSHRSARLFQVPLPADSSVRNVGFHDVNYHSGEPWSGTDWPSSLQQDGLTWQTSTYGQNPNANALRWSTLYNFRFETDVPPTNAPVAVGLFRPGTPSQITVQTTAPVFDFTSGNADLDGDVDFADFAQLQLCFSTAHGSPAYEAPPLACLLRFDFNDDGDIDAADYEQFRALLDGP